MSTENTPNHLNTISAAARAVGVAPDTLRDYERRGIVAPVRDSSGRRLFSEADIEAARRHRWQSPPQDQAA
jgi:MerR family transcriptional regulator/heat shock protein HspR